MCVIVMVGGRRDHSVPTSLLFTPSCIVTILLSFSHIPCNLTHLGPHACTCARTHMHTCTHTVRAHTYMNTYVHIRTHKHTHSTSICSPTCRDQRLRHHLGTRYDARDGVFDWDYHMRLGEMVRCPPAVGSVTGSGARGTHTGGDGRLSTSGGSCYRVWCTWYTHWGRW